MKLSIVIPCYNEPETIGPLVERVFTVPLGTWEREVIVVDDGSADATKRALAAAKSARPEVVVITHPQNSGKGAALKSGFAVATGDYLAIMDADLEYDPADLSIVLAPIDAGTARVVLGSRQLTQNNVRGRFFYYWGGRVVNSFFNLLFGTHLSDLTVCIKVFPRELVPQLLAQRSDDFVFDAVELSRVLARGSFVEVPVQYHARDSAHGKKLRMNDGIKMAARMLGLAIEPYLRIVRLIIIGGSSALFNIVLLYVFKSVFGFYYLYAAVLSFTICVIYNFTLQRTWAFKGSSTGIHGQVALFVGVNLINLGLNTLILYGLVEYLGIQYLIGQAIASILIALESYFVYKKIIFR